ANCTAASTACRSNGFIDSRTLSVSTPLPSSRTRMRTLWSTTRLTATSIFFTGAKSLEPAAACQIAGPAASSAAAISVQSSWSARKSVLAPKPGTMVDAAIDRRAHCPFKPRTEMPVINRAADLQEEIVGWRHDFHRNPELLYDVERTAARVADLLRSFGVDEVVTGIGRTGVVGVIRGGKGNGSRVIGLRADMDALPINERTGKPYASTIAGKMHACGHDGHTSMLLGAAKYLAETRNFA